MSQIQTSLEACLGAKASGRTIGREKHLYSIYEKMRIKRKSFSDIMDVYAFRIIVDSVDTCYRVLGAVHNLYKPVPAIQGLHRHPQSERLSVAAHRAVRHAWRADRNSDTY